MVLDTNFVAVWDGPEFLNMAFENSSKYFLLKNFGPFHWQLDNLESTNSDFLVNDLVYLPKIHQRLLDSSPLFARHYDAMPDFELDLRKIAFQIITLKRMFASKDVSIVIFPTAVPHHLDSLICQIACELQNIRQIFFYPTVIDNRILPLEMTHGIETRKPVGIVCSSYEFPSSLEDLKARFNKNLAMDVTHKAFKTLASSTFNLALAKLQNRKLTYKQRIFTGSFPVSLDNLRGRSFFSDLRLIRQIDEALKFLKEQVRLDAEFIESLLDVENCENTRYLAIFAHFQPESSTFPEGHIFGNHIDLISFIRSTGYLEPILYKEHPALTVYSGDGYSHATGCSRRKDYYEQLRNLGCYFVGDNFQYSNHRQVIPLTITGTIAIERSLVGLQTVVAGKPWFRGMPGIISLDSYLEGSLSEVHSNLTIERSKDSMKFFADLFAGKSLSNVTGVGGIDLEFKIIDLKISESEYISFVNQLMLPPQ